MVSANCKTDGPAMARGQVVKIAYLKKLKTMRKKLFVLRADSENAYACLEYYDSAKKWENDCMPKKRVILRNCLSISRRRDTKHKYVIGLYWGVECFSLVFEGEDLLREWLELLLAHQRPKMSTNAATAASGQLHFEHVWRVTVRKKELAAKHNLNGVFLLALTKSTLGLVRHDAEDIRRSTFYEFSLQCIRRCGNLDAFFYLELGQASCFGAGNLWMQVDDSTVALSLHSTIMRACVNCPKNDLLPKSRGRSSSANEASKPIQFGKKWSSCEGDPFSILALARAQSQHSHFACSTNFTGQLGSYSFAEKCRDRCDSLPTRPYARPSADGLNLSGSFQTQNLSSHSVNAGLPSPAGHPSHPTGLPVDNFVGSSSLPNTLENVEFEIIRNMSKENLIRYLQISAADLDKEWPNEENFSNFNYYQLRDSIRTFSNSSSNSVCSCSTRSLSPGLFDMSGYLPMSAEVAAERRNQLSQVNRWNGSADRSREGSICQDLTEGYVSMAPLSVDAGYASSGGDSVDRKRGELSSRCSTGSSSCSINSSTNSTDGLLSKLRSFFGRCDENLGSDLRQQRAYSTGSRPLPNTGNQPTADGYRIRAFSAGSRFDWNANREPPRWQRQSPMPSSASHSNSSLETNDHLVEIDYGADRLRERMALSRVKYPSSRTAGIACGKMLATQHPLRGNPLVEESSTSLPKLEDDKSGYVDMMPLGANRSPDAIVPTTKKGMAATTTNVRVHGVSTLPSPPPPDGYLDMSFDRSGEVAASSAAPIRQTTPDGYLEMSFKRARPKIGADDIPTSHTSCLDSQSAPVPAAAAAAVDAAQRTKERGSSSSSVSNQSGFRPPVRQPLSDQPTPVFHGGSSGAIDKEKARLFFQKNFVPLVSSTFAFAPLRDHNARKSSGANVCQINESKDSGGAADSECYMQMAPIVAGSFSTKDKPRPGTEWLGKADSAVSIPTLLPLHAKSTRQHRLSLDTVPTFAASGHDATAILKRCASFPQC